MKHLTYKDMKPGIRYLAKQGSDDATFRRWDHVVRHANGDIECVGYGWIDAKEAENAAKGMRLIVDVVWAQRWIEALQLEIERLRENYGVTE